MAFTSLFIISLMYGTTLCESDPLVPVVSAATDHGVSEMSRRIDPALVTIPPPYQSKHCEERRYCSDNDFSFPDKNCYCDNLCQVMNDCCKNVNKSNMYSQDNIPDAGSFKCSKAPELREDDTFGTLMVKQCGSQWTNTKVKELCENKSPKNRKDMFLRLPVSDKVNKEIMYKNMYCAHCNNVYDFLFWNPTYKCQNDTDTGILTDSSQCTMVFTSPSEDLTYKRRRCMLETVISSCGNETIDKGIKDLCENETYFVVTDTSSFRKTIYKNEFCAMCNGIDRSQLNCRSGVVREDAVMSKPASVDEWFDRQYSFRILVDINQGGVYRNTDDYEELPSCAEDEIFDIFIKVCKQIFCTEPTVAVNGRCVFDNKPLNLTHTESSNATCIWTKLESDEFRLKDSSDLLIISTNTTFTNKDFIQNGSDVFICLPDNRTCVNDCHGQSSKSGYFDTQIETLLSTIGLIISIVALAVTFILYVTLQELLNVPGKILLCLVSSLFWAQLLFLLAPETVTVAWLCKTVGILIHYFFLCAFCWMNVIAFDLWMTFSRPFMAIGSKIQHMRQYHGYAWFLPLSVVLIAIMIDLSAFNPEYYHLKPQYGEPTCWINSQTALLLFFVGPLAVFKMFDFVSFVFTAVKIYQVKKDGSLARQKNRTCTFLINIKLSIIMGLTWIFAFVATATNEQALWYLFIVFNTFQGLFIAVCFLCTRKVWRLTRGRFGQSSTTSPKTATENQIAGHSNDGASLP